MGIGWATEAGGAPAGSRERTGAVMFTSAYASITTDSAAIVAVLSTTMSRFRPASTMTSLAAAAAMSVPAEITA